MFEEKYQKASDKIKEVVDSYETATILGDIARKYSFDEKGFANPVFGRLVGKTLIGLQHPKDFVPSIEKELGLSKETAQTVAKEINEKIFSQVKDDLILLYDLDVKHPKKESSTPLPQKKSEVSSYNTSSDLFEKKLQQSVVSKTNEDALKKVPSKTQTPPQPDSYREPTV